MSRSCIHCGVNEATATPGCEKSIVGGHSFMKDGSPYNGQYEEHSKVIEARNEVSAEVMGCKRVESSSTELYRSIPFAILQRRIHRQNRQMGWWDKPREMGTLLCLVHSEISEAMEGARKNLMDDHLPHRSMLEVELADAIIRILDIAESENLDVIGAIVEKVAYNRKRADHQPGARAEAHGKKF